MQDHISEAARADDLLLTILDQPAYWTLNGRDGVQLGKLFSLRAALRAVFAYEAAGHPVFAVCQQPGDAIILFREQIARVVAAEGLTTLGLPRNKAA